VVVAALELLKFKKIPKLATNARKTKLANRKEWKSRASWWWVQVLGRLTNIKLNWFFVLVV
jgi:hypothetical protein